jgi:hypothetical protein
MWVALLAGAATGNTVWLAWGGALVAVSQAVRFWLDRIFGQDVRFGVFQPVGALLLVGLVVDSARRSRTGRVAWKGRTYTARPADAA